MWIETPRVLTFFTRLTVTPHTGVWIETARISRRARLLPMSPPIRGCGLKLPNQQSYLPYLCVTPHTGVWIETVFDNCLLKCLLVTPHTGVWIETISRSGFSGYSFAVTPHTGVWIETLGNAIFSRGSSHPPYGGVD